MRFKQAQAAAAGSGKAAKASAAAAAAAEEAASKKAAGKGKGGGGGGGGKGKGGKGGGGGAPPAEMTAKQAKSKRKAERAAMEAARKGEVENMMKVRWKLFGVFCPTGRRETEGADAGLPSQNSYCFSFFSFL